MRLSGDRKDVSRTRSRAMYVGGGPPPRVGRDCMPRRRLGARSDDRCSPAGRRQVPRRAHDRIQNGKPKTKEGSWEAGVDGALPGIIMPADPQMGMTYREEYYKGHAEDGASIISTDAPAKVPYGRLEESRRATSAASSPT